MMLLKALNFVQFQRTPVYIISFHPDISVVRHFPLLMVKEKLFLRIDPAINILFYLFSHTSDLILKFKSKSSIPLSSLSFAVIDRYFRKAKRAA